MKKTGLILIISLFLLTSISYAEDVITQSAIDAKQLEIFRAQILKDFDDQFKSLKEQMIANEDANSAYLDDKTNAYMIRSEKRIIVGVLGLSIFINCLMAYLLNRINKKYSLTEYERQLQKRFPAAPTIYKHEINKPLEAQFQEVQQPQQPQQYSQEPYQEPQYPIYQDQQYQEYPQEQYPQEQMR
jgi:hypothetical protein